MTNLLDACAGLVISEYAEGDILLAEGAPGGRLLVLVEGAVVITRNNVEVARADTPGAMFGEMSVLLDQPYSASVIAASAAKFHVIEDAAAFLGSSADVGLETARLLAQRLHDATTYLADFKRQYGAADGHFGLVDDILDSLMNQQRMRMDAPDETRGDDPRIAPDGEQ